MNTSWRLPAVYYDDTAMIYDTDIGMLWFIANSNTGGCAGGGEDRSTQCWTLDIWNHDAIWQQTYDDLTCTSLRYCSEWNMAACWTVT